MKALKILFLLLVCPIILAELAEIQNGETIDFNPNIKANITYNFIIPQDANYKEAVILYKIICVNCYSGYIVIKEDDIETQPYYSLNYFNSYRLNSINQKIITFNFFNYYSDIINFTLLDLTKEINVGFDSFLSIIPSFYNLRFRYDPVYCAHFNIKEITSDQIFYFLEPLKDYFYYEHVGNGRIEYCNDDNCLNNLYISTQVIHFKKGSKYKIFFNYLKYKFSDNLFLYSALEGIKITQPQKMEKGLYSYIINKSNLYHFFLVDKKNINPFFIYTRAFSDIQYSNITEEMINDFPDSLNQIVFQKGSDLLKMNIKNDFDYALIILKDEEKNDINIFYIFNHLISLTEYFSKFTLPKSNYSLIQISNSKDYFFKSVESNIPCLRYLNEKES